MTYFTMGFIVLILVVVVLLARGAFHQTADIVLPQLQSEDGNAVPSGDQSSALNVVRITPDTVQLAISTLSRPAIYSRTQTVETFWSGGSGRSVTSVAVSGGRTRLDTQLAGDSVCHMLVVDQKAAVWYDEETSWTELRAERFTADLAQRMLSYETILSIPVSGIAAADYRDLDGTGCIYVETAADEAGYSDHYWVSVSTGLLVRAERSCEGELVYRFTASALDVEPPEESLFRLPDGREWED